MVNTLCPVRVVDLDDWQMAKLFGYMINQLGRFSLKRSK